MNETRYPLCWPSDWKRTQQAHRTRARFSREGPKRVASDGTRISGDIKRLSIDDSFKRIEYELERFGVDLSTVLVSTNLSTNMRGVPMGNRGEPSDPGVAVYWQLKGKRQCMAIDRYDRVADNLAAVAATLEAMRAIERHGGGAILERAFLGFAQLPSSASRPWREVFEVGENRVTRAFIEGAYRGFARVRHPDAGGSHEAMAELSAARDQALAELSE